MRVRIRFGRGSVVSRKRGKNAAVARLIASLLTLIAICLACMGFWRLFQDLDLAGDFVFSEGFLSHWQVWLAAACALQYGAWRLTVYARPSADEDADAEKSSSNPAALPL
jgi:hypothetical protein